jgi:AAA family ATP:ADP antiporter
VAAGYDARMTATQPGEALHNSLAALLGPRRSEYGAVAWSFLYFSCVLSAYYILRPIREEMAVGSGPNTIPLLFTGTFAAMLVATTVFGWVASRYPRRRFLPWVYLFFMSNVLLFWGVFAYARANDHEFIWAGRVFFVWLGVFNLFVVSVFWSFMADIWTQEQARRLFGFIAAGGSIGALAGGFVTSVLVTRLGFQHLFPISAGLLCIAIFCIYRLRRWVEREHRTDVVESAASTKPLGGDSLGGLKHVFRSPYFSAIAVASVIASLLGTALYIFAAELVEAAIPDSDERVRFFSNINIVQNGLTFLGQLFLVRHVVQRFGVGVSLSLLPIASIAGFALLAVDPVLAVVAVLTVLRRALGFAFSKPSTDMLYSVVSPEDKYKAKNFIDTAVYRGGDVFGVWVVDALRSLFSLGVAGVSLLMLPFAMIWAALALWLGREYRRRSAADPETHETR